MISAYASIGCSRIDVAERKPADGCGAKARKGPELVAVNTKGLFFTLQAVARQMIAQGRGGKIINFSSQAGRRG